MRTEPVKRRRFYVLGPLMGGHGSRAFLGQELTPSGRLRPAVMIFLPDEVNEDQELLEKIRHETEVAVRLDHHNIITVLGLIKLEDGYARVVEYADAESLRSVFSRAREVQRIVPPPLAAAMLADACAGVQHAHEIGMKEQGRPLLHEAIRPDTILVSFKGLGLVTGYGSAAIVGATLRAQDPETSLRDPYSAPEQVFGGREAATVQTDVYGLGTVLFEALAGTPPMESPSLQPISNVDPSRNRLVNAPQALAEIALKAIAKKSKDRFSSVSEMREALLKEFQVATPGEVAAFMQEIFPDDMPQIQARRAMLKRGQVENVSRPPPFDGEGLPETAVLVWRYPVADVDQPPSSAPSCPPATPSYPPAAPSYPPAATPVSTRPSIPPPPFPEPETRRSSRRVYLVWGLIGVATFLLGLFLSDLFKGETPEQKPAPAQLQLSAPAPAPVLEQPLLREPPAPQVAKKETEPASTTPPEPSKIVPLVKEVKPEKPAVRRPEKYTGGDGEQAATGYLNVDAPSGSKVFIRGRLMGVAPLNKLKLPVGKHKVLVINEETGQKYEHTVPVGDGQDVTLTVDFY